MTETDVFQQIAADVDYAKSIAALDAREFKRQRQERLLADAYREWHSRPTISLDIETKRKGSSWGDYALRDLLCADMLIDGEHLFLPFDFNNKQFDKWIAPLYDLASTHLVIGHNVIKYDLTGLNGVCTFHMKKPPLPPLLVTDTLAHGPKSGGMTSRRLGTLANLYGIDNKGHIEDYEWEAAFDGDPEMRIKVREYNQQDTLVTLQLRDAMLSLGHLAAPKVWKP